MNSKWFLGVASHDAPEKQRRFDLVTNSRETLGLLAKVLTHELLLLDQSPVSDYSVQGWALREADRKGQIRALKNVLSLCDHQTEGPKNA